MTIYRKVRAVERVFNDLSKGVAKFQNKSGLSCVASCGLCCFKPDISASPLEFLPLAYDLFKKGMAESFYDKIIIDRNNKICPLLKPMVTEGESGFCTAYSNRGMICRLFGFSAMLDKAGLPELVTCRPIKQNASDKVNDSNIAIKNGLSIPVMRNYYFQLQGIDAELGTKLLPVREAIIIAIQTVLSYYAYRPLRKSS